MDVTEDPSHPDARSPVIGEVDGVRSVTLVRPDQTTEASLVFASGTVDERPWQRHGLHLLEHLVTAELRDLPAEINGSVDRHTTTFDVSAPPQVVRTFLERVCRLLSDPPMARRAIEARVLAVEGDLGGDFGPLEAIAVARYGHTGAGVLALPDPHPGHLGESTLRELADRCFRRELAQLLLVGAPVHDLRLPLGEGTPTGRGWVGHRQVETPTVVLGEVPRLGVSVVHAGDDPVTAFVCQEVMERRVEEALRHRRGWSYDITTTHFLGAGEVCHVLHLDLAEDHVSEAGRLFRDVVTDLFEHGPSDQEVGRAVQMVDLRSHLPMSAVHYEIEAGIDLRAGLPPARRRMDTVLTTTVDAVSDWLRTARGSALWYAPEEDRQSWHEAGWTVYEGTGPRSAPAAGTTVLRAGRWARLRSREERAARLVIGDDSITEHRRDGTTHIRDQDVVAVIAHPLGDPGRSLVAGSEGTTIEVGDSVYPGSSTVLDRIRTVVGPHVFYQTEFDAED